MNARSANGPVSQRTTAARLHVAHLGSNTISERKGGRLAPVEPPRGGAKPELRKPPRSERKGGSQGARSPLAAELPKRVLGCANRPAGEREGRQPWRYWAWRRDGLGEPVRHAHRCRSWRCAGECSRSCWGEDWHRIKGALEPYPARSVSYLVLTLDRHGAFSGFRWNDEQEAYRELSRLTRNFLARLKRIAAERGWDWTPSHWVGTVEAHRSGWPHMNMLIVSSGLAEELRAVEEATGRAFPFLRGELLEAATETGWGAKSAGSAARDVDALAGYLAKLAGEAGDAAGEIAKMTQAPLNAKGKLRRLRSGKGFLPPRKKSDEHTGAVVVHADSATVRMLGDTGAPRARESAVAWRARMRRVAYHGEGPVKEAAAEACRILAEQVNRKHWRAKLRRLQRALDAIGWCVELWPRPRETERERESRLELLRGLADREKEAWRWGAGKTPLTIRDGRLVAVA